LQSGILLIGHGTRDTAGVREFWELADLVKQLAAPIPVEACFLELAEPSIAEGVKKLAVQGIERMLVAPLLLFSAGHHQRDVPDAVNAALAQHPGITTAQLPALNDHPRVLALSQRRLNEAHRIGKRFTGVAGDEQSEDPERRLPDNASSGDKPAGNRLLLVVGRGSSDAAATGRLRDFAAQRAVSAGVQAVLSCFVHGQRPTLAQGLALAANTSAQTIVVQPHLLFHGLVYQEIAAAVEQAAGQSSKNWQLAAPLGPDPELARAILELAAPWLRGENTIHFATD
jgi:sirohydrochlorin cobaltochelatase